MKVVFLYPISSDGYNYLKEELPDDIEIKTRIRGESLEKQPNEDPEIIKETKEAEILMGPYVTEEILSEAIPEAGGKLKLIFVPWTGVDRLNFELLRKYKIPVANSHGNARTTAEHAVALLLTAARNIIHHDRLLRKGDWSSRFKKMPSINLTGKTVGLLGFGTIATECARLLKGFELNFIGCRREPKKSTEEQKMIASKIYSIDELDQFLKESDVIINSLPLTDETRNLLGNKEFEQMKENVIIVNIGRGHTIEENAFYEAIENGKIFAAGIDPMWNYPKRTQVPRQSNEISNTLSETYPSKRPIHEFDNVVLSPHRAAHTIQSYERGHWQDVIENILRIYHGKEPINIIDLEKGY